MHLAGLDIMHARSGMLLMRDALWHILATCMQACMSCFRFDVHAHSLSQMVCYGPDHPAPDQPILVQHHALHC